MDDGAGLVLGEVVVVVVVVAAAFIRAGSGRVGDDFGLDAMRHG